MAFKAVVRNPAAFTLQHLPGSIYFALLSMFALGDAWVVQAGERPAVSVSAVGTALKNFVDIFVDVRTEPEPTKGKVCSS